MQNLHYSFKTHYSFIKPIRGASIDWGQLANFSSASFLCVTFWIERHRSYTYFTHVTPRVKEQYFLLQSFSENEKFSLLIIGRRLFSWKIVVTQLFLSVGPLRDTFLLLLWKYFPQIQQPHFSWERDIRDSRRSAKSVKWIAPSERLASQRQHSKEYKVIELNQQSSPNSNGT